jgi:hypothetical protein
MQWAYKNRVRLRRRTGSYDVSEGRRASKNLMKGFGPQSSTLPLEVDKEKREKSLILVHSHALTKIEE